MRIEPEQVRALVKKLREWGYEIHNLAEEDLVDEFDVRSDIDVDKIGKFTKKSEVSRKAALANMPKSGTQRRRVYEYIYYRKNGVSREEIARVLGIPENSVRPRVAELMEGGWVKVLTHTKNRNDQIVELLIANEEKKKW